MEPAILVPEEEAKQYRKLLRRIRSDHPAVSDARALLDGQRPRIEDGVPYHILLTDSPDSRGKHWREAQTAAWVLGYAELTHEARDKAVEALTDQMMDRVPRSERNAWVAFGWSAIVGGIAGIIVAIVTSQIGPVAFIALLFSILFTFLAAVIFVPVAIATRDSRREKLRQTATTTLGRIGLAESVGWLSVVLSDKSRKVRRAAGPALRAALPALTEVHFGQLDGFVVQRLCLALRERDKDLVRAAVEALGKVGDGRAVAPLERLRTGSEPALAALIDDVLPELRRRARLADDPRTLLRASSAVEGSLLRSSRYYIGSNPEQLLRAVDPEGDSGTR